MRRLQASLLTTMDRDVSFTETLNIALATLFAVPNLPRSVDSQEWLDLLQGSDWEGEGLPRQSAKVVLRCISGINGAATTTPAELDEPGPVEPGELSDAIARDEPLDLSETAELPFVQEPEPASDPFDMSDEAPFVEPEPASDPFDMSDEAPFVEPEPASDPFDMSDEAPFVEPEATLEDPFGMSDEAPVVEPEATPEDPFGMSDEALVEVDDEAPALALPSANSGWTGIDPSQWDGPVVDAVDEPAAFVTDEPFAAMGRDDLSMVDEPAPILASFGMLDEDQVEEEEGEAEAATQPQLETSPASVPSTLNPDWPGIDPSQWEPPSNEAVDEPTEPIADIHKPAIDGLSKVLEDAAAAYEESLRPGDRAR